MADGRGEPEDGGGTRARDPLLEAVGARVKDLRLERCMTPAEFARAGRFTVQYLWNLERGTQNLSLRSLSRLAIALDVPMTALLEGIEANPATLAVRKWTKRNVRKNAAKPD